MADESRKTYYSWISEFLNHKNWNVDELMQKSHNSESEYLEFKGTVFIENATDNYKEPNDKADDFTWNVLKAVIAFANGTGGCILLGVDDKTAEPIELMDKDKHRVGDKPEQMDKYIRDVVERLFSKKILSLKTKGANRKKIEIDTVLLENLVKIHRGCLQGKRILCLLVKMYKTDKDFFIVHDTQSEKQIVCVRGQGDAGWTRELTNYEHINSYERPYVLDDSKTTVFSNFQDPSRTFVGRQEELDNLNCILQVVPKRVPIIHGSAGIGKTEFAIKYAHQYQHLYSGGTLFVHAEGCRKLREALSKAFQLKDIRAHFGIGDDSVSTSESVDFFSNIFFALERVKEDVLILLDNVDCLDMFSNAEFDEDFPERVREKIHLYATTRLNTRVFAESDVAVAFKLDGLSKEDALALLKSKRAFASTDEQQAAEEIVEYSNGNAWMLDLLSESIKQTSDDESENIYRDTLERLKSLPFETLRTEEGVRIKNNVLDALELLKPTLDKLSDEALTILQYSALCTPENVYLEWLRYVYEQQLDTKQDDKKWNKLIRSLVKCHLWTKNEGQGFIIHPNIRMHRLTQIVVRKYHRPHVEFSTSAKQFLVGMGKYIHERDFTCSEIISMGTSFCQLVDSEYSKEVLPLLYSLTPQKDLGDFLTHYRLFELRKKAWEVAAVAIEKLDDANPSKECYTASSCLYRGHIVMSEGDYSTAMEFYQKALDIRKRVFGENNECTGLLYSYIGSALALSGNSQKAKKNFSKSIYIQSAYYERCKAEGDIESLSVAMETLVRLYRRVAEALPDEMEMYYEKAISLAEEIALQLPQNKLLVGETHFHYADRLLKSGQKEKALEHYRNAQVIYSAYLSPSNSILKELSSKIDICG